MSVGANNSPQVDRNHRISQVEKTSKIIENNHPKKQAKANPTPTKASAYVSNCTSQAAIAALWCEVCMSTLNTVKSLLWVAGALSLANSQLSKPRGTQVQGIHWGGQRGMQDAIAAHGPGPLQSRGWKALQTSALPRDIHRLCLPERSSFGSSEMITALWCCSGNTMQRLGSRSVALTQFV